MAAFFKKLDDPLKQFIGAQQMFFTASAAEGARINLSPKGMDTFRIFDDATVGYLDFTGSGNETSAHIERDGRLTIMMCSFGAKPQILRLYGRGRVIRRRHPDWDRFRSHFEEAQGDRQVILLDIELIQTSCGYAVPRYEFNGHRDTLMKWIESTGKEKLEVYWEKKGQVSLDGLPTGLLRDV